MLSPQQKETVTSVMDLYCPILKRFFQNTAAMDISRFNELGFVPAPPVHTSRAGPAIPYLNESMKSVLADLMPSEEFYPRREEVRVRLQRLICTCDSVPPTTELVVFGSSRNNFGNDGADLDMCLHYAPGENIPTGDDRGAIPCSSTHLDFNVVNSDCLGLLIEKLGVVLAAGGMENVQVRCCFFTHIWLYLFPLT